MKEESLIEIASEIIKCDCPLWISIYIKKMLSALNEDEYKKLQEALKNPKYDKLNIFDKYLALANDYLKSKNITVSDVMPIYEENGVNEMTTSYLDNMLANDQIVNQRKR